MWWSPDAYKTACFIHLYLSRHKKPFTERGDARNLNLVSLLYKSFRCLSQKNYSF